jgi:hypothetical protein
MPLCNDAPPGLFTDDVCRVPALTNFSIVCWMRWEETLRMAGSAGAIKHLNQCGLAKGDYYSLLFVYRLP